MSIELNKNIKNLPVEIVPSHMAKYASFFTGMSAAASTAAKTNDLTVYFWRDVRGTGHCGFELNTPEGKRYYSMWPGSGTFTDFFVTTPYGSIFSCEGEIVRTLEEDVKREGRNANYSVTFSVDEQKTKEVETYCETLMRNVSAGNTRYGLMPNLPFRSYFGSSLSHCSNAAERAVRTAGIDFPEKQWSLWGYSPHKLGDALQGIYGARVQTYEQPPKQFGSDFDVP